jgi:23S rRNA pseudouridine2457 synthase
MIITKKEEYALMGIKETTEVGKHRYFIVNKPCDMVSQFVSSHKVRLLGELDHAFPEGTHAIGRLDNHSEGLLILTTNKRVTKLLFESKNPHKRTYLAQVKNAMSAETLEQLRNGVSIQVRGGGYYTSIPCHVQLTSKPANLFLSGHETILYKEHSWLLITLTEGKFHQVRKMMAAVNHRCKRLIRLSIEDLELGNLQPGAVLEMEEMDFFTRLKIESY